jgi:hypothetical protein
MIATPGFDRYAELVSCANPDVEELRFAGLVGRGRGRLPAGGIGAAYGSVRKSLPLFVSSSFLADSLSAGTIRGSIQEVGASAPFIGVGDVSSVRLPTTLRQHLIKFQKTRSNRTGGKIKQ